MRPTSIELHFSKPDLRPNKKMFLHVPSAIPAIVSRTRKTFYTSLQMMLVSVYEQTTFPRVFQRNALKAHFFTIVKPIIINLKGGLGTETPEARHDLLEIIDDRHGRKSTIVTSQLPTDHWHEAIGDATLADAILDRLVHS